MKLFGILLMLVGATSLAILFSTVAEYVLSERLSSLFGGQPVPRKDHVIVVGAGHIGLRVAEQLIANQIPAVLIESEKTGKFPADIKRHVAVIEGDARNPETLHKANLSNAKAVLVVCDDDIENLSIGLSAQNENSKVKTVIRIFDADLGEKLQSKLNLSRILSVSAITAPYFVAAALVDDVAAAIRWRDNLLFLSKDPGNFNNLGLVQIPGSNLSLHVNAIHFSKPDMEP
jgi:hypothetical protein